MRIMVSLRGTHGSGKSTVVKSILDKFSHEAISGDKKPNGYSVQIPYLSDPLYVVGAYTTACGGCDGIQPYSLIWPRVEDYFSKGHVLFEGALISSSYGNIGRASEKFGDQVVFAFMDTPLQTCIDRILQRRSARGVDKPFNPKNTISKYNCVLRSIEVTRLNKRRVLIVPHKRAVNSVLGLFLAGEKNG